MRILRFILVIAGCLHLCGGHYGVLQVLAWGKMMVDYSAENGLVEGAKQTFDGNHPCELCHSIDDAKKEKRHEPQVPGQRDGSGFDLKKLISPKVLALKEPRFRSLPKNKFLPPFPPYCGFSHKPEIPPPRLA